MRTMNSAISAQSHRSDLTSSCAATHDAIARAAFRLYQQQGSQDGHDLRHWLDAEVLVQTDHASIRPAPQIAVAMSGRLAN